MADFSALKTAIQTYIKQNGNEEITGEILQEILLSVVTTLGDSAINDLVTALAYEVVARQNADGTLQQNIANEATARGNADTALGGRIDDEATARANADTALSNRLGSTITAENTAADQIGEEAEAREAADTALQGLIDGITDNIENGYVYAGIATPSSTPVTGKVFYLALTAGTYTNFGGTEVSQGINILKYNGSAWSLDAFIGIDDTPTPNSPKLVKSGGVFDKVMTDGSAFDISVHFASGGTLATYADLSDALTALNSLSADYKKGGMSIKFVQSSDNKYVQYRLMALSFSTTENDWQGVDDNALISNDKEPTTKNSILLDSAYDVSYISKPYRINANGTFDSTVAHKHICLPVNINEKYHIAGVTDYILRIAFATTETVSPGGTIPVVSGTTICEVPANTGIWVRIPEGCTHLLVWRNDAATGFDIKKVVGVDAEPKRGSKNFVESNGIFELIDYIRALRPELVTGEGINKSGADYSSNTVSRTHFIKLVKGADIFVNGITGNTVTAVAFYDKDHTFIECEDTDSIVHKTWEYLNSIDAVYFRCSIKNTQIQDDTWYIYNGEIDGLLKYIDSINSKNVVFASIGLQGKKVSLLGDSNWVYQGISTGDSSRYGDDGTVINGVDNTWWGKFISVTGAEIEVNASVGSTSVTDNEYYGRPGFLSRVDTLGNPDIVMIGGGLNEPPSVEVGTFDPTKDIDELDTLVFADAYDKMVRLINQYYSTPRKIMVIHPITRIKLASVMIEIAEYYNIDVVDLRNIRNLVTYVDDVHYDQKGANSVSEYMLKYMTLKAFGIVDKIEELYESVDYLDNNTLKESEIGNIAEDDVAGYLNDKDNKIIGKLLKNGSVQFLGGGGFDGEMTESKSIGFDAVKVLIDKKGSIIGWITSDGKVHIEELEVNKLKVEGNTDIGVPEQLFTLMGIIADGTENNKFVNDKTLNLFFAQKGEYRKKGTKIETCPVISINDDDAQDYQMPTSQEWDATDSTPPSSSVRHGGYASLLWPLLNALNIKHSSTINGKLTCGVCAEGQRIGLTPLYSLEDTFTGELNSNGKILKALVEHEDWECELHSMTARYYTNSYLVNGLDSEFANSLLVDAVYAGPNGLRYNTTTCYDTVTKKNYKVKQDLSGWDECPVHYAKPYLALSKESNSQLIINPTYSVKYQVKTWMDRAAIAHLPYINVLQGWGSSHSSWHVKEDMKYVNTVTSDTSKTSVNTVPFRVCPHRYPWGAGNSDSNYNVYNKNAYQSLIDIIDTCVETKGWCILRGHIYENQFRNYYISTYESLYGADAADCGSLCYKDDNYPEEWVLPLKYAELMDMLGENVNDYWNNPPVRLNIQSWAEWYPCPGTTLAMLYDALEYAISKGVKFSKVEDVLKEYGNMFAIGCETLSTFDADKRLSAEDKVTSFCRIGADGSIVYKSNEV